MSQKKTVNIILRFEDCVAVKEMNRRETKEIYSSGHAFRMVKDGEFFNTIEEAKEFCKIDFDERGTSYYTISRYRRYPISHARRMVGYVLELA